VSLIPDTDICILGGGIMGVATAYSISKTSQSKILLLDRYGVGNDYCSSNDVNRVFRYSYGEDEYYTRMAMESLGLWRLLERESGQQLLAETGLLLVEGEDENANMFNEASYRTLLRMGLGAERLEGEDLKERFPQFETQRAFFDPHGGVLLASRALSAFAEQARSKGVRFLQGQARTIRTDGRPQIETVTGETVRCQKLVVTMGPWSNSLLKPSLPRIVPTRQQLIYFHPRTGMERFRPESCPVFFTDEHYGLPAAGIEAVKVSAKELPERVDPETVNRSVDIQQVEACRDACRRFIPGLADGEVVQTKVCLYDMTGNSDFVLDRDPENHAIVYGYGFSGHGFKFAPLIGKLLAELVLDEKPSFDISRFTALPSRRIPGMTVGPLGQG
jgi:monomeric sarcosine oxidase